MAQAGNFGEFEATSLFCPRCRRATPARKKLLLVLPNGGRRQDRQRPARVSRDDPSPVTAEFP
jgi:hypothetical protein